MTDFQSSYLASPSVGGSQSTTAYLSQLPSQQQQQQQQPASIVDPLPLSTLRIALPTSNSVSPMSKNSPASQSEIPKYDNYQHKVDHKKVQETMRSSMILTKADNALKNSIVRQSGFSSGVTSPNHNTNNPLKSSQITSPSHNNNNYGLNNSTIRQSSFSMGFRASGEVAPSTEQDASLAPTTNYALAEKSIDINQYTSVRPSQSTYGGVSTYQLDSVIPSYYSPKADQPTTYTSSAPSSYLSSAQPTFDQLTANQTLYSTTTTALKATNTTSSSITPAATTVQGDNQLIYSSGIVSEAQPPSKMTSSAAFESSSHAFPATARFSTTPEGFQLAGQKDAGTTQSNYFDKSSNYAINSPIAVTSSQVQMSSPSHTSAASIINSKPTSSSYVLPLSNNAGGYSSSVAGITESYSAPTPLAQTFSFAAAAAATLPTTEINAALAAPTGAASIFGMTNPSFAPLTSTLAPPTTAMLGSLSFSDLNQPVVQLQQQYPQQQNQLTTPTLSLAELPSSQRQEQAAVIPSYTSAISLNQGMIQSNSVSNMKESLSSFALPNNINAITSQPKPSYDYLPNSNQYQKPEAMLSNLVQRTVESEIIPSSLGSMGQFLPINNNLIQDKVVSPSSHYYQPTNEIKVRSPTAYQGQSYTQPAQTASVFSSAISPIAQVSSMTTTTNANQFGQINPTIAAGTTLNINNYSTNYPHSSITTITNNSIVPFGSGSASFQVNNNISRNGMQGHDESAQEYLKRSKKQRIHQNASKIICFHIWRFVLRKRGHKHGKVLVQFVHHCAAQVQKIVRGFLSRRNFLHLIRFQRTLLSVAYETKEDKLEALNALKLKYSNSIRALSQAGRWVAPYRLYPTSKRYTPSSLKHRSPSKDKQLSLKKAKIASNKKNTDKSKNTQSKVQEKPVSAASEAAQIAPKKNVWDDIPVGGQLKKANNNFDWDHAYPEGAEKKKEVEETIEAVKKSSKTNVKKGQGSEKEEEKEEQKPVIHRSNAWDEVPIGGHKKKTQEADWQEYPNEDNAQPQDHLHVKERESTGKTKKISPVKQQQLEQLKKRTKYNPLKAAQEAPPAKVDKTNQAESNPEKLDTEFKDKKKAEPQKEEEEEVAQRQVEKEQQQIRKSKSAKSIRNTAQQSQKQIVQKEQLEIHSGAIITNDIEEFKVQMIEEPEEKIKRSQQYLRKKQQLKEQMSAKPAMNWKNVKSKTNTGRDSHQPLPSEQSLRGSASNQQLLLQEGQLKFPELYYIDDDDDDFETRKREQKQTERAAWGAKKKGQDMPRRADILHTNQQVAQAKPSKQPLLKLTNETPKMSSWSSILNSKNNPNSLANPLVQSQLKSSQNKQQYPIAPKVFTEYMPNKINKKSLQQVSPTQPAEETLISSMMRNTNGISPKSAVNVSGARSPFLLDEVYNKRDEETLLQMQIKSREILKSQHLSNFVFPDNLFRSSQVIPQELPHTQIVSPMISQMILN